MLFDDDAWLGSEHAWCGPYARAAIGVLIPKGDWRWWHLASFDEVLNSLKSAVGGSGIAAWGGDEAVLDLNQWVEPVLAVRVAKAFSEFQWATPRLRLKITRDVWRWSRFRDAASTIRSDLAKVLSSERIFLEWPRGRRPRRSEPNREEGKVVVTATSEDGIELARLLSDRMGEVTWRPHVEVADVVVAMSADELADSGVATDLAVVLESDPTRLLERLDGIRAINGARCVVRLPDAGNAGPWLISFGQAMSDRSSVDDAVARANEETGVAGEVMVANQTFLLQSPSFLSPRRDVRRMGRRSLPPQGRQGDLFSYSAAEFLTATERALPEPPRFPPPAARVLNAAVYAGDRPVASLPETGAIQIEIDIRPKTPLQRGVPSFPDHLVRWRGDSRILQVHMVELGRTVVTRSLSISRTGGSDPIRFAYELVTGKAVDLRLMVCDGAHILQTARFQGFPGQAFEFFVEAEVTSVDDERKAFDLALLVNDSLGNKPSVTTLTEEGVYVTVLENNEIGQLRDECRRLLEPIVTNPDLSARDAMFDLAQIGGLMLDALRDTVPGWPKNFSRVQLMTKADAFFPFEYLYDGPFPERQDVELCPERHGCLSTGRARSPCPIRQSASALCPMGFLGVSTIIERQRWDRNVESPLWLRLPTAPSSRKKLTIGNVAFAASNRADNFHDDDLPVEEKLARISDVAQELGPPLQNWDDWKAMVVNDRPSMLVLIAHVERNALHIGTDAALPIQAMKEPYLGDASIAIAIGCSSAIGTISLLSLPSAMMRNGVRVVIAALTDVLGRYSNEAAKLLATRIRDASRLPTPATVGEFVTEVRRQFLARNIALGLVLVAFGDADLALGGTD